MRDTWLKIVRKIMPNICKGTGHVIALHVEKGMRDTEVGCHLKAVCTLVSGNVSKASNSCAQTLLVDIHRVDNPEKVIRTYAVIDCKKQPYLCQQWFLQLKGPEIQYELTSCSGHSILT